MNVDPDRRTRVERRVEKFADWKKIRVSLGTLSLLVSIVYGAYEWVNHNLVYADEFHNFKGQLVVQRLEDKREQLDAEVFKLEIKRQVYPKAFDAVDRAVLDRSKEKLRQVETELQRVKEIR